MKIHTTRGRLLASTVLCGALALGAASAAHAQTAPAPAAAQATAEIVVTGTRIKGAANATSPSPISVTTSAQIALTKADTIEEVLQHMTGADFTGGLSNASNNGGVGLSEISLRNLGPTRALVLIDGQRLIPISSGSASATDLNSVPISMVDRIDVLRDGASSIYGADAIGGVVNIITKKNADGMTADASYGQSSHGDGAVYSLSSSVGVNSDKGNVMIGVSWDHRDAIQQADRSWAIDPHLGTSAAGGSAYRGQINILQQENGDVVPAPTLANPNATTTLPAKVWANGTQYNINDGTVNWGAIDPALLFTGSQVKMNAGKADWNDLTGGMDRKQLSFNSHYNLTDNLRFVAEGFFTDRQSSQSLRPEPLLGDTISTTVFQGFILPADQSPDGVAQPFYLTPNQFGPRLYRQDSKTYRLRTGFEGTIFGKYDWEAGYVYQSNSTRTDVLNEANFEHLAEITEQIACLDVPGGCHVNGAGVSVPTVIPNWTGGPNNIFTAAQVKFLTFDNTDLNTSTESYGYANISGPIWELPAGELKGSVGAEYRQEHEADLPSALVQEGWGPNQSAPTGGGYNVQSIYGELVIPVLKDMPFVQELTLTPSARYDHYNTFGGAFTNKVGVNYKVNQDLRFRFSYATGFRAPSVNELFGGQFISDNGASGDPCDSRGAAYGKSSGNPNIGLGVLTAGSTCSVAVAHGAAVTNFQPSQDNVPSNQIQVLEGGNPQLKPEQSESYALGVVITPRWTPGLSISADYYSIRISNTILTGGIAANASPDLVLDGCYGTAQNQSFCSLVTRNSAGVITQLNSLNTNFGTEKVQGIDYQIDYDTAAAHLNLPMPGSFRLDLQASNLFEHKTDNPDGSSNNYTGTFNLSGENVQPRWKGTASVDYRLGPWTAHYDVQYFNHTRDFQGTSGFGDVIPDMWYNNISASYSFSDFEFLKKARVTVGIDNVADKDPPFLKSDSTCKCNSIAGPFDFVGRFFYGRISTSF
ncbi:MAG TPA: TonB-dependent receptor [Caulobacteraceae bacterium]|jgi:iron complex outermembrane receptor protein